VRIRKANLQDLNALMKVEQRCFPPGDRFNFAALAKYLQRSLTDPKVSLFVLDSVDKTCVGYALGEIGKTGNGKIIGIGVLPPYKGQGLGRTLLARVEKSLVKAGANKLVLQVRVGNDNAIRLYETKGFRKTRRLQHYYATADGYEMVKIARKPSAWP
jgi:ribosomal protein S18 acetylase RimI-like enzyme